MSDTRNTTTPAQALRQGAARRPSNAIWARALPQAHVNFIPAQSWLEYSWTEKDPEMDFVLAAIEQSGMTLEQIERETEKFGHRISRYTMMGWLFKGVKRPQNCTMSTVMAVCGYERPWRKVR